MELPMYCRECGGDDFEIVKFGGEIVARCRNEDCGVYCVITIKQLKGQPSLWELMSDWG